MDSLFRIIRIIGLACAAMLLAACEKVSLSGVLIGNTSTDDRVEMSMYYFTELSQVDRQYRFEQSSQSGEYSFLVGADSHMALDAGRLSEMFDIAMAGGDSFCCHLGDIADTQAAYYSLLHNLLEDYKMRWHTRAGKRFDEVTGFWYETDKVTGEERQLSLYEAEQLRFPLYVAVGNHDITRNGWAMFADQFQTSFFQVFVILPGGYADRLIFLDSANGTMGHYQTKLIEDDILLRNVGLKIRNLFVFTHSNFFRPMRKEFSATYAREELYFLLDRFSSWGAEAVFCGHVHAWDDRVFGGVRYLTLDAMSERNSPEPGDYLVRVIVKGDGVVDYERVRMNYTVK